MALNDYKITDNDINTKGVVSAPDKLTGTPQQNKGVFDKFLREVLKVKLNGLIDAFKTDAVLTSAQSLTEEQKAAARDNIGVSGADVAVNSVNGKTGAVVLDYTDVGFKDLSATLAAGDTELVIEDESISSDSMVEIFTNPFGVIPEDNGVVAEDGIVTITFEPQENDVSVVVRIS